MINKILTIIFIISSVTAGAQVTINVQLPPGGMVQKDQLWNLAIINNNASIAESSISMDVQDAVTGQTILSASSRIFPLGKGIKLVNPRDVQPVQYNFLSADISGNYIPLGTYIVCYRVISNTDKGPLPVGDECVKVNINPLSPPLLTTPADRSVLETAYPQFSWLPPTPSDMFRQLSYDIVVAEILPGQTPAEAVLNNTPVYSGNNLRVPFESYPASISSLKPGLQYAWQVVARNGLNYSAQTETWAFSIKSQEPANSNTAGSSFVLMKPKNSNGGYAIVTDDILRLKFYSFDKTHNTEISFFSAKGEMLMQTKQEIVYGDNFISVRLPKKFETGKTYRAELKDTQGTIYSTQFHVKENDQN